MEMATSLAKSGGDLAMVRDSKTVALLCPSSFLLEGSTVMREQNPRAAGLSFPEDTVAAEDPETFGP